MTMLSQVACIADADNSDVNHSCETIRVHVSALRSHMRTCYALAFESTLQKP